MNIKLLSTIRQDGRPIAHTIAITTERGTRYEAYVTATSPPYCVGLCRLGRSKRTGRSSMAPAVAKAAEQFAATLA